MIWWFDHLIYYPLLACVLGATAAAIWPGELSTQFIAASEAIAEQKS